MAKAAARSTCNTSSPLFRGRSRPHGRSRRREMGHGKLAERAFEPFFPPKKNFPIPSASNPISQNLTVPPRWHLFAAAALRMMDAGVPIKRPVAGIAMGLILEGERLHDPIRYFRHRRCPGRHGLQSRRRPPRDHRFPNGHQSRGHHARNHASALQQAKEGRIHILNKMLEVCPSTKRKCRFMLHGSKPCRLSPAKLPP